jgi:predicted DNA-binding transcriptional regulator AlpA
MSSPRAAVHTWRGLRREEAAHYIGVSPSKFDEMVRDGRMPRPFHIDKCAIWDVRDLDLAFEALKVPEGRNPWDDGVAT